MSNAVEDLRGVFEEERKILISGQFENLDNLIERKTVALAAIAGTELDVSGGDLNELAKRNAKLLKASIAGVVATRDRLLGRNPREEALHTYTSDGRRCEFNSSRPRIERRR